MRTRKTLIKIRLTTTKWVEAVRVPIAFPAVTPIFA